MHGEPLSCNKLMSSGLTHSPINWEPLPMCLQLTVLHTVLVATGTRAVRHHRAGKIIFAPC